MKTYLLAAGRGRRAGGPKAWSPYDSKTLLERQLDFLLSRFQPSDIFISVQKAWLRKCRALNPGVRWVEADPDLPALASLATLIKASAREDWAFAYHVDMPVWEPALFNALAARASETPAPAIAPRFAGRRGHPVLLSPLAQRDLGALDPLKDRLDSWLAGQAVADVDVEFPCVRENWNEGPARV